MNKVQSETFKDDAHAVIMKLADMIVDHKYDAGVFSNIGDAEEFGPTVALAFKSLNPAGLMTPGAVGLKSMRGVVLMVDDENPQNIEVTFHANIRQTSTDVMLHSVSYAKDVPDSIAFAVFHFLKDATPPTNLQVH